MGARTEAEGSLRAARARDSPAVLARARGSSEAAAAAAAAASDVVERGFASFARESVRVCVLTRAQRPSDREGREGAGGAARVSAANYR